MATTAQTFVLLNGSGSILQGSTTLTLPAVAAMNPVAALAAIDAAPAGGSGVASGFANNSATPIDRIVWDLALTTVPPALSDRLLAFGHFVGGFNKNGALYFTLTGTTAVSVDFTTIASAIGVASSQAGDTLLATINSLSIINASTAASTIVVSPGASNPLALPNSLGGTSPTFSLLLGDIHCEYSLAGQTVNGTHKILTFTPTAGGAILLAYGGS